MTIEPKMITCKNGANYKIEPIGPDNAEQFLDFMQQVSGDTHFMTRYGDEVKLDNDAIKAEKTRLKSLKDDDEQGMLSIFDGDRIIANIAIRSVAKYRKTAHRCSVGLGVRKEYHGIGLGTILMDNAISFAKAVGYTSMELGVLSDNMPAQGLYKKMGFVEYGRLPGAFILDDGTSLDEINMYKKL